MRKNVLRYLGNGILRLLKYSVFIKLCFLLFVFLVMYESNPTAITSPPRPPGDLTEIELSIGEHRTRTKIRV